MGAHAAAVELLISAGAAVDALAATGRTALSAATDELVVSLLLSAGAAVELEDGAGRTALMVACFRGDAGLVQQLVGWWVGTM